MRRHLPVVLRLRYALPLFFVLAVSTPTQLRAARPAPAAADSIGVEAPAVPVRKRDSHLVPRDRSQHTFYVNAGASILPYSIYTRKSTSGSINKGFAINAGYSWISRRGLGAGIVYSGCFLSAKRNDLNRMGRIHYIGAEFVGRQRVGRRWLFRESFGIGFGVYSRTYGERSDSNSGPGTLTTLSVHTCSPNTSDWGSRPERNRSSHGFPTSATVRNCTC